MSITSRIRKSPVVVTTILLAFVAGYLFPYLSELSSNFFSPNKVNVGTIAGHKVPYYPDYRRLYDDMLRQEIQMYGGQYEGIEANVHRKVWEKLVLQYGFKSTYDALGVGVTSEERYDMVIGNDVPEQIRMMPRFQAPAKQAFDRGKYLTFWKTLVNDRLGKEVARGFEEDLTVTRRQEKLSMLIVKSMRTPQLMKKKEKRLKKAITVRVLYIPCATISDSVVRNSVSEQDKQAYYKEHKKKFAIDEKESSKTIEYVQIPILPDSQEKKKVEQKLKNLKERFLKVKEKDAEAFAKQYSDNPDEVLVQWGEKELPDYMRESLAKLEEDEEYAVIGPVPEGTTVVLYKYIGLGANDSWSLGEKERIHRFVKIERKVDTKGLSKSKTFTEASNLVKAVKRTKKWKDVASEEYGLSINEAEVTLDEARKIGKGMYRKLFRWLYCDAKMREVSPPIEVKDSHYVVAVMTKEKQAGFSTPQEVEKEIETTLFNERKVAKIKKRLLEIGIDDKSLHEIKKAYGSDAFVDENRRLEFTDNEIIENNYSPRAVGSAFGLERVGERTTIIEGEHGVYIIERLKNSPEAKRTPKGAEGESDEVEEAEMQEQETVVRFILESFVWVDDQRFRFYD